MPRKTPETKEQRHVRFDSMDLRQLVEVTKNTIYIKASWLVSKIYGIEQRSLWNWKNKGCPWKNQKGWNLLHLADWRRQDKSISAPYSMSKKEREQHLAVQTGNPEVAQMIGQAWDVRKEAADAQLAEIKLQKELDRFAERDMVERTATRAFTNLRQMLKAVGVRVKTLVPERGEELRLECDQIVSRALEATKMVMDECPDPEDPWALDIEVTVLDEAMKTLKSDVMGALPAKARSRPKVEKVLDNWIDAMTVTITEMAEKHGLKWGQSSNQKG